ncbi:MAG: T9SS type A sorting domain-containing protein, partial [Bacteroidaceae bacterium]|nr:T9SS type A sorting domain-containing protein [Bacteroidaceae bacterium]
VEYSVYPNPASDYVYTNAQGELSIYNVAGNLVRQAEGNCVEVRDLPSGMYILNITNGNDSQSVKFIKK